MNSKMNAFITGKIYEMKKEYPIFREFHFRMQEVGKRLNADVKKNKGKS